jgi:hypothetical protein
MRLRHHTRRNQRREQRPDTVAAVHTSLHGVCVVHNANPSAEGGVGEAIPEPGDGVGDDEDGERRVRGQDAVGDDVAYGCGDGDASLAELGVDGGVGEGGGGVAREGGEEDERDDGVVEVVVFLEGGDDRLRGGSVGPAVKRGCEFGEDTYTNGSIV